jgi:hypothetical protein
LIASNCLSNNKPFVIRPLFPKFHSHGAKHSFRDELNGPPQREQGRQNVHEHCVRMGMVKKRPAYRPVMITHTFSGSHIWTRHCLHKKFPTFFSKPINLVINISIQITPGMPLQVCDKNHGHKTNIGSSSYLYSTKIYAPVPITQASQENLHIILSLAS